MTTTAEVRAALADAASYCGRPVKPYQQDSPTAGSGYVGRRPFDPRFVFQSGKAVYPFTIVFFFNRAAVESSQAEIDVLSDIAGAGSLLAAVQNEANWPDDLVDYCQVVQVGEVQVSSVGGSDFLSVEFDIEVVW